MNGRNVLVLVNHEVSEASGGAGQQIAIRFLGILDNFKGLGFGLYMKLTFLSYAPDLILKSLVRHVDHFLSVVVQTNSSVGCLQVQV
jgi:hypothetical protein